MQTLLLADNIICYSYLTMFCMLRIKFQCESLSHVDVEASYNYTNGQVVDESAGFFEACVTLNQTPSTSVIINIQTQQGVNTQKGA